MNRPPHAPIVLSLLAATLVAGANAATPSNDWPATKPGEPAPKVATMPAELARNLETFDDLDYNVYSHQQWENLHKSHAKDIVVYWPDGRRTQGLETHIEDLKVMFTFAPDARVTSHPVRFGTNDAEWTAVTGWVEGTFSKPMTLPDGTVVQPTNKSFRIPMATIGHWNKQGTMSEEYLFLDNAALMQQIGVGK
jgi:SnoaL-like polyketide cyclase